MPPGRRTRLPSREQARDYLQHQTDIDGPERKRNRPFLPRAHREDDAEARFAAVHLFVGFCNSAQRVVLNHRVHAAQRAEFEDVLPMPHAPNSDATSFRYHLCL